jgi:hypothetical protein
MLLYQLKNKKTPLPGICDNGLRIFETTKGPCWATATQDDVF